MKIVQNIAVPTGNILIVKGHSQRFLECLSIGDYGKDQNIKADFLGLDRELTGVPNGKVEALEKKWVITISTQFGCSMGCVFCDVPKVGPGINAPLADLRGQVAAALSLHPEVKSTERLNLHYARMGEPTFNSNVLLHAIDLTEDVAPLLGDSLIHPVVSTMLPRKNSRLELFLAGWCFIKNNLYDGDAGLQFSINSTDEAARQMMFNGNSLSLEEISEIGKGLPDPVGRKYALNIALIDGVEVSGTKMARLFSPDKFMCKITPIHVTTATQANQIKTSEGYTSYTPYAEVEHDLKKSGFDVLVFVPSLEEDQGRITCGNAILSGTLPECDYHIV